MICALQPSSNWEPSCEEVIVQVPVPTRVTIFPETTHAPEALRVTGGNAVYSAATPVKPQYPSPRNNEDICIKRRCGSMAVIHMPQHRHHASDKALSYVLGYSASPWITKRHSKLLHFSNAFTIA